MQFPNAYQGVKRLFFAEILGIITTLVSLMFVMIASGIKTFRGLLVFASILTPLLLGLSFVTFVIRFLALGRAAQDEESFATAQIANLISFGLTLLNQFVVKTPILSLVASIASICTIMFILSGIMNLALRLRDADTYDRGKFLKRLIWFLILSPFVLLLLAYLLKTSSAAAILVLVFALVYIVALIAEAVLYVCYLLKAKKMLHYARLEEWDPMGGVSSVFRPVDPDANPW